MENITQGKDGLPRGVDAQESRTKSRTKIRTKSMNSLDNSGNAGERGCEKDLIAGLEALSPARVQREELDSSNNRRDLLLETVLDSELYKYLTLSSDVEDLKQRVVVLIDRLGFTDFAFSLMDTACEQEGLIYSGPSGLIQTYYGEAFYRHDITLKYLEVNRGASVFRSTLDEFINGAPITTKDILRNQDLSRLIQSYGYNDYYAISLPSCYRGHCLMTIMAAGIPRRDFRRCVGLCSGRLQLLCCAIDYICAQRFASAIEGKRKKVYRLTARPLELLKYIALDDCTLYQAADKMNISVKTANVHIANAKKVFGVSTSTAAVTEAIRHGLIILDQGPSADVGEWVQG